MILETFCVILRSLFLLVTVSNVKYHVEQLEDELNDTPVQEEPKVGCDGEFPEFSGELLAAFMDVGSVTIKAEFIVKGLKLSSMGTDVIVDAFQKTGTN